MTIFSVLQNCTDAVEEVSASGFVGRNGKLIPVYSLESLIQSVQRLG